MKKTAIATLCVLVGALAYFRVTDTKDIEQEIKNNPQLGGYVTYRVQLPPPGVPISGGEYLRESEFLKQVAVEVNKKLLPVEEQIRKNHDNVVTRKIYHPYKGLN